MEASKGIEGGSFYASPMLIQCSYGQDDVNDDAAMEGCRGEPRSPGGAEGDAEFRRRIVNKITHMPAKILNVTLLKLMLL